MDTRKTLEFKVGIFVSLGILAFMMLVFSIRDFREIFRPKFRFQIIYQHVSGVEVGAPVKLAGVEVGEVEAVKLFTTEGGEMKVAVTAWAERGTSIPRDSRAYIASLGLLGEKYVKIYPGMKQDDLLRGGDTLLGEDPVSMEELAYQGEQLMERLNEMVTAVNSVMGDEEVQLRIRQIIRNSEELTARLKELSDLANTVLARIEAGEGTVGKLLTEDKIYRDLEELVADIKRNPWKLLKKSREENSEKEEKEKEKEIGRGGYVDHR